MMFSLIQCGLTFSHPSIFSLTLIMFLIKAFYLIICLCLNTGIFCGYSVGGFVAIIINIFVFLFDQVVIFYQCLEKGSKYAAMYDKNDSETAKYQGKFLPLLFNRFSSALIFIIIRLGRPILRRRRHFCS